MLTHLHYNRMACGGWSEVIEDHRQRLGVVDNAMVEFPEVFQFLPDQARAAH